MTLGQAFGTEMLVMWRILPESRDPFQTESPKTSECCALHENSTTRSHISVHKPIFLAPVSCGRWFTTQCGRDLNACALEQRPLFLPGVHAPRNEAANSQYIPGSWNDRSSRAEYDTIARYHRT